MMMVVLPQSYGSTSKSTYAIDSHSGHCRGCVVFYWCLITNDSTTSAVDLYYLSFDKRVVSNVLLISPVHMRTGFEHYLINAVLL